MSETPKLVHLNVGGKKFTTQYDTLLASPYFEELLKNKKGKGAVAVKKGDDTEFFIDRDGVTFEELLNCMRTMTIQATNQEYLERLLNEAKFFKMHDLCKKIQGFVDDQKNQDSVEYELIDSSRDFALVNTATRKIDTNSKQIGDKAIIAGISYNSSDGKISKFVSMTTKQK